MPQSTLRIPKLTQRFLALTGASPGLAAIYCRERESARKLLRQCRRRGYPASVDAAYDLDWIEDLVEEVEELFAEWLPDEAARPEGTRAQETPACPA